MQAEDNGFYLNRDELREYSTWGCYYPRRLDLRGLDCIKKTTGNAGGSKKL